MKQYETESISRYINFCYRRGIAFLGKEYKSYGIGAGQYQFLIYLYMRDGLTHDELTEKIGVDKASTTRALLKLEETGYITKVQDVKDKRKYYIYLTAYAKQQRTTILNISRNWEKELTQNLSSEELLQLYTIFRKIVTPSPIDDFKEEQI